MTLTDQLYDLFRRNLPFIRREEETVRRILDDDDNSVIIRRDRENNIIGACVMHKNAVYLFCVDKEFRRRGTGSRMLFEAEKFLLRQGYDKIIIGVGDDYLMPGVPCRSMVYEEDLMPGDMYDEVDDSVWTYFRKRGYKHSWGDCNCFDMRQNLKDFNWDGGSIGDTIDGVTYRWAEKEDIPAIAACTDDAHEEFTKYYLNEDLYSGRGTQRVLIAVQDENVLGTLIVSRETEGVGTGSVGCTAVRHAYRGRHIAANMVLLGSKWLKDQGMDTGFLGYTYSGLDKLYGIAGYKICVFYAMAEKRLV